MRWCRCVLGNSSGKPIYLDFISAYLDFISTPMICTETIVKIHYKTPWSRSSIARTQGLKLRMLAGNNHNYLKERLFWHHRKEKRIWHIDCLIYTWESAAERVLDCGIDRFVKSPGLSPELVSRPCNCLILWDAEPSSPSPSLFTVAQQDHVWGRTSPPNTCSFWERTQQVGPWWYQIRRRGGNSFNPPKLTIVGGKQAG